MAQIGVILFVALGILSSSSYGYELPSPTHFFSKVIDKANSFVGRQKQSDTSFEIPENAYSVEMSTIPFTCENDGLFPFPDDCTMGLLCKNKYATVFTCTDIWHFNNVTKQCDEFCSARCDPGLACSCGWDTCQTSTEIPTTEDLDVTREKPKTSIVCLEDGLYQHPTDCNLFAQCLDGTAYLMQCPPGLHFNIKKARCERPCDAACDPTLYCGVRSSKTLAAQEFNADESSEYKTEIPFICRRDGLIADRENCTQYTECFHGRSILRSCPTGEHFNKKTKKCDTPCNAKCDPTVFCPRKSSQTEETPIDEDFETTEATKDSKKIFTIKVTFVCFNDGLFSYPKDCNKYVNCSSGNSYEQSCPLGLHFNSVTKRCETPCSAKCDPTLPCKWRAFKRIIKESPEELCSKDGVYRERNPMDCKSYFRCENGDAELFHCSEGEHFNQETLRCEDACDAHCDPAVAEKCGWESTKESEDENSLTQPIFDFTCEENGLFENPHACENFIQCTGGHAYLINCQYGMHYNSETQRCMTPCEARCDSNYESFCKDEEKNDSPKALLRDFDCETDGYHVDPLDCKGFIQCFRGSAYAIACPPGLHYSPTLSICMTPCEAKCVPNYEAYCRAEEWSRSRSPQIRNPVKQPFPLVSELHECMYDGNYPNPEDCSTYIQCMMGQSFITRCPEGLHFNEKTQQCESPCDAHCDSSIGDICEWEKPSTESTEETSFNYDMFSSTNSPRLIYHFTCLRDGIYKNPENCSTFIQCSRGHSYLMACPEGLHFSEETWRCETPCDARCNASIACDCGWDTCTEVEVDCKIEPEVGPCKAQIPRYYYDTSSRRCRVFIYGGCGGNSNNFETKKDCEDRCQKRILTLPAEVEVDCEIEPEVGPCTSEVPRYYYDISSGRCRGFTYGGCEGNSNNFITREDCEEKCQKRILRRFRCPSSSGRFGHFSDCMSYYHCKRGIPTLKRCPKGTAFDQKKSKCVTEYEATCVYQCREKDAVYPYEEDCRKYIDCVNGISKLEKCPLGKAFDPIEKDCIDEKEVSTCF